MIKATLNILLQLLCHFRFIAVTGGERWGAQKSTTEILDLSQPEPEWKIAKELELPFPIDDIEGTTIGTDFYVSGGDNGPTGSLRNIYRFQCINGKCNLESFNSKLDEARDSHVVIPIPASLADCD